jgi:nitroimidazol reductase NimA-like FMN-containing flavoprotein (pyridoxamine 5'-phosphate oxidase superfamily)
MLTPRTRVRREPQRGAYDVETIHAILDEALVCHVGFVADGQPFVVPTLHARVGDRVLVHGSAASRMLRALGDGAPICLTVTIVDGVVLARSVFNHSANYRSAVLLGTAVPVNDEAEKVAALAAFTEKLMPGRWDDARQPTRKELKATHVFALPIEEGSAKVRTGPPEDDEEDYALDVWAGVVPLALTASPLVPDPRMPADRPVPSYLDEFVARHAPRG